jgi:hypothetical protein
MKIPLSEQIEALEIVSWHHDDYAAELYAALSTLKWVEKHQAELRVLAEFAIEAVTVREAGE